MESYCLKDLSTGKIFKVFSSKQELNEYLKRNPQISECIDCIECDDAPSITLE